MGGKLNRARKVLLEKERITRELEIAREIQNNILPREYPGGPGFEFAGAYRSAREVGGDYYDFINIDDNRLGFLVADVSGKSLPGMLVMLLTRDIILRYAHSTADPAELLTRVNRELLRSIKQGMFVTMLYAVLDKRTGRVEFASAGHNPLIKISGATGESDLIKTRGFPLGMIADRMFSERIETGRMNLEKNDRLVLYTDGVNEAQSPEKEEFGMSRLVEAVGEKTVADVESIVDNTLNRLAAFVQTAPQYDDITVLAMKWHAVSSDNNVIDKNAGEYVSK
jgi:serine phosphatase RsbU (regulator of sigma subunit)